MLTPRKQAQNSLLNTLLKRKPQLEHLGPLGLLEPLARLEIREQLEFKAHRGQLQQLERREQQEWDRKVALAQQEHKEPRDREHKVALAQQV
jgi:hypothetical protein